jgi:hypothetical protein
VSEFSACFLLVFGQLAFGGVVGLAVPPFEVLDRGFYRSSAGIFLGSALAFLGGRIALIVRAGHLDVSDAVEVTLWSIFCAALALYVASLWSDSNRRRARTYLASFLSGLAALSFSALTFRLAGPAISSALYPLAFVSAALVLGAVATGMLLGHWYLIDLGLSIEPLARLLHWFLIATWAQLAVLALTTALVALGSDEGAAAVGRLWREHRPLLVTRIVLGPAAALAMGYLIQRTLRIPQTMAATGLFYVAILAVMVGEMLGRLILFRTSLPL